MKPYFDANYFVLWLPKAEYIFNPIVLRFHLLSLVNTAEKLGANYFNEAMLSKYSAKLWLFGCFLLLEKFWS